MYLQSASASSNTFLPPITKHFPKGRSVADNYSAYFRLPTCFTFYVFCILLLREMMILSLLGSGCEFMDSNVFLPMMMLFLCKPDVVMRLNIFISEGNLQGSLLFFPIPPLRVLAMTRSKGIWR